MVAEHLAGGAEAWAARHEAVIGVLLVALAIAGGSLAIGTAVQQQREHLLGVPAALDEFSGEPVEQLGVDGQVALAAELLARAHDADAEDRLPEAVHRDAGGERVVAADDPAGEAEAVLRISIVPAGEMRRYSFVHLIA